MSTPGMTGGPGSLAGRVAIVTGGSRGIGAAIARQLAERGATVVVASRGEEQGRRAVESLVDAGHRAEWEHLDVADDASWQALAATIRGRHGRLDIAVNNAAVAIPGSATEVSPADWNTVIASCLSSVYFGGRAQLPLMIESGGGSIVNMGSTASVVALSHRCAYVTAKHGLIGLTKSMALDYAEVGIRVNAIVVGGVDTEMLRQGAGATPEGYARLAAGRPMRRLGEADEVAAVAVFLAGDASTYMTGSVVAVDGGLTIQAGIPPVAVPPPA
jgi:NAD(P)-dependent dehydrogenase (short-subunit alcohol dehydrogenase family)